MSVFKKILIISPLLIFSLFSSATDINSLQKTSLKDQLKSQQAQIKINQLDDQKQALIVQVNDLQAEAKSLEIYNQYLSRLLADQETEKTALSSQINSVTETRQG